MGWGNCGNDSQGRGIGYCHEGICDYPGCNEKIDRGLAYACSNMHGETEYGCEKYFCTKHKSNYILTNDDSIVFICDNCFKIIKESMWEYEFKSFIEDKRVIIDEDIKRLNNIHDSEYNIFIKLYNENKVNEFIEALNLYLGH